MAEIIEVKVHGDPEQWLAKAKKTAAGKGVEIEGEIESGVGGAATSWFQSRRRPLAGTFTGKGFEGSYRLSGGTLALRIDKKPFFLPWGMVKEGVKGFIE